jgi:DNA-binding CsgD family transcriptional regulator
MANFKVAQRQANEAGPRGFGAGAGATSCIDLAELERIPVPSERVLQKLFQLTPAETRLARSISSGDTLEEAARTLGIKVCTARTQLASIFAKTGTNRQSQLTVLLVHVAHVPE